VAEEFRFQQVSLGIAAVLMAMKGLLGAGCWYAGACDQLLAGAGFAGDQHVICEAASADGANTSCIAGAAR